MKTCRFAPATFMIVFCCAYGLVFARDWPLFRFYPLHGNFNWGTGVLQQAGPAMAWYGLMSSAAIIALVAALIAPDRAVFSVLRNYLWLFPCAAMLTCVFLLRRLFT